MNTKKLFTDTPVWKSLLIMSLPAVIISLVTGAYLFSDTILSVNLASEEYSNNILSNTISGKDQVRLFMNGYGPINALMLAFTLLFGLGTATRTSINLGAKNKDRAINSMRTGFTTGMALSIIMVPILFFSAKPWIGAQFDNNKTIVNESFNYAWIIIVSFPMMMFNQIIPALFRTEGRNKETMIAMMLPIGINLLMDWVMMGPASMGVEGGAWATFISTAITTTLLLIFMMKKNHLVTLKNIFHFKGIKLISIIGIMLVGIAPFIRNVAQSITSTVQMTAMSDVSNALYGNPTYMKILITGAMPIFMLFFPLVFGFAQGARPLASFFYGAKEYEKVKKVYWYTILYSSIMCVFIYFMGAWALATPLIKALGVSGPAVDKTKSVIRIMLLLLITFSFALGGMILFGSTDRLILSIISSAFQGLIVFWPTLYSFRALAIHFTEYEFLFWWFWPTTGLLSSFVVGILTTWALKKLGKDSNKPSLDEKIESLHKWARNRRVQRKEKRKINN